VRAILINPFAKTVTEVDTNGYADTYGAIQRLVFGRSMNDTNGFVERVRIGAEHSIYIDEEGMLVDWDHQAFFKIGGRSLAGNGVIVCDDDWGGVEPCDIPLDVVTQAVEWLTPQEVDVPAPRIHYVENGVEQTELIYGVDRWNYKQRPVRRW